MTLRDLEQSHANLSRVPPLDPNRLIGFINHFAASLVQVTIGDVLLPLTHQTTRRCSNSAA